jgi:hypothetical protein
MIWSRYHKFLTFLAALAAAASLAALVLPAWGRRDHLAHLISLFGRIGDEVGGSGSRCQRTSP